MIVGKLVGFFRETHAFLTRAAVNFPSFNDCIRDEPSPFRDQLISYLKAGHEHDYASSRPILKNSTDRPLLSKAGLNLTDGVWIWPWELSYYVENFNLALPTAFVDHARENNWKVPDVNPDTIKFPDPLRRELERLGNAHAEQEVREMGIMSSSSNTNRSSNEDEMVLFLEHLGTISRIGKQRNPNIVHAKGVKRRSCDIAHHPSDYQRDSSYQRNTQAAEGIQFPLGT